MTYDKKNRTPGVMKFAILVVPSLVIITVYLVYPKITTPLGGVMKLTNSCLLTLNMLHTKFG